MTFIGVMVIFTILRKTLKQNFATYYRQQRSFLWTMQSVLLFSITSRLILLGIRCYLDLGYWCIDISNPQDVAPFTLFQQLQDSRKWIPPVYFGAHFFFINFIQMSVLLFNFGFALSNKKSVMSSEGGSVTGRNSNLLQKNRRDTFLNFAIGDGSDDEDEDQYVVTTHQSSGGEDNHSHSKLKMNNHPFRIGSQLRNHIEKEERSPISSPKSQFDMDGSFIKEEQFEGEDERTSGMFGIFRKITQKRRKSTQRMMA